MRKGFRTDLNWSDVTPKQQWLNRRQLMAGLGAAALAAPAKGKAPAAAEKKAPAKDKEKANKK